MNVENKATHIALTMDGNRRWAKQRNLPTEMGHMEGALRIEPIVNHAAHTGVDVLSFYAFARKNINRPDDELKGLNHVYRSMLQDPVVDRMLENNVQINWLGEIEIFPQDIVERTQEIKELSLKNSGTIVNFALNYDGRHEIVRAINHAREIVPQNQPISEQDITANLYTAGQPEPMLVIRTGGEQRDSGFLIWQAHYSPKYYTDTLWPDFHSEDFDRAREWLVTQTINNGR